MRQLYEQKSQHHWQTLIADNKGNAKKLWRTFDSILRTSKRTMTTKNSTHTADEFSRFFSAEDRQGSSRHCVNATHRLPTLQLSF